MDTKRLALACAVSAAVVILWNLLFPPPAPPARPRTPQGVAGKSTPTVVPAAADGVSPTPAAGAASRAPAAPARVEPIAAADARELVVSNALYTARLSNRGGELLSYTLNRYQDHAGRRLDLVRHGAPFPGTLLRLDGADPFLARARGALHQVEHEEGGGTARVTFRYREADGNALTRTYTFRGGYVLGLTVEREGAKDAPVAVVIGPGIGNPSPEELKNRYTRPGQSVVLHPSGRVERHPPDALKETVALPSGLTAVGLEENYFVSAFLPQGAAAATLRPVALGVPTDAKTPGLGETEVVLSAPGKLETELFLGPKELGLLEKLRPGMARFIDFGWYVVVAKPLLYAMKAIHGWVGNYGVAIILITVIIRALLYPLTHKQLVSMKKMSKVQPKMEAIRVKWAPRIKQDPQARLKMQEEMMQLYKTEGVNPYGGCLPFVIQIPIFVAFYNVLAHAIELRHAPFALWITDLSAKDPYYVTPILMTVSMWVQQQLTPATADPMQKRIFAVMPFVFGFFFKDLPSGLVLYWLVQNILGITQQMVLNRLPEHKGGNKPK